MLSLYSPLVLSLVWGCESLVHRARRREAAAWFFYAYHTAIWLLVGAIGWRIIEILRFPFFKA